MQIIVCVVEETVAGVEYHLAIIWKALPVARALAHIPLWWF